MGTPRLIVVATLLGLCGGLGCGSDPGATGADASPAAATAKQFCVSETNRYRAMNGKPALTESAPLEAYADTGAMVDFSSSPHNHFSTTSGGGIAFAENECPVQGNWMLPAGGDLKATIGNCVAAFYAEGPGADYATHGHYINMMGNYASLGCGVYQMGTGLTIVQDYGN
jgi:hypothetical protein